MSDHIQRYRLNHEQYVEWASALSTECACDPIVTKDCQSLCLDLESIRDDLEPDSSLLPIVEERIQFMRIAMRLLYQDHSPADIDELLNRSHAIVDLEHDGDSVVRLMEDADCASILAASGHTERAAQLVRDISSGISEIHPVFHPGVLTRVYPALMTSQLRRTIGADARHAYATAITNMKRSGFETLLAALAEMS